MPFAPGQIIQRRYVRDDRYTWVQPMRVVADDDGGLLLWHPVGSDWARLVDADGNTQHELPVDRMRDPRLKPMTWEGYDILVLMPPDAAYSVWWFFSDGLFVGWYVNLEDPYVRRPDGVDSVDLVLDIRVLPDRSWSWKDEDEFAELTGHPLYFDASKAAAVRAEGESVVRLVEAGAFPFDGTYADFRPDPSWSALRLPEGWDDAHSRPAVQPLIMQA